MVVGAHFNKEYSSVMNALFFTMHYVMNTFMCSVLSRFSPPPVHCSLGLWVFHLLLSSDLITWFSFPIGLPISSHHTHSHSLCLSPPSLCPFLSRSLSLSFPVSISIYGLISSSLISFIPSNPHLLLTGGRERERESFSQVNCHQSFGGSVRWEKIGRASCRERV